MAKTLSGARFTMWATVIPRMVTPGGAVPSSGDTGSFAVRQDPDSGQIITYWQPGPTDPPLPVSGSSPYEIQCYARAYTALGYRSSANRETIIQGDYSELMSIQFDFPKDVVLNHQTLITNIRGIKGVDNAAHHDYFWLDGNTGQPTVFEVQGVSPVHDPFGKWIRNTTVLKRAEVQ